MKVYSGKKIRNVAVLGHSGTGKTTIVEAALNVAEITNRMGKVDDGNTVSDYDSEEIKRGISIGSSIIPIEWKDEKINFIDVPGYFDFVGEMKQALNAADIALIIVSARSGIEVGTEKAWEYATELNLPKIIFVNNMDDDNADFDKIVEDLKAKFGKSIAPIQAPFKENNKFIGFVNTIKKEGRKYVDGRTQNCPTPEGMEEEIDTLHTMIVEAVADTDDELMEKYFEDTPFTVEEMQNGIRTGIVSGAVTPVLCGSALHNIGTRVLMNTINEYIPPAADLRPTVIAKKADSDEEIELKCTDDEDFSAFVFKTIADPYVGRLSIFRVCSGTLTKDTPVYNSSKGSSEKISRLYVLRGNEQIEVKELKAGDIGAISKLNVTETQDTLSTKKNPVILPKIDFPVPLYSMVITAADKGDEDKIGQAISKFLEEDKTLDFKIDRETKESVISGMGDAHLDILANKLASQYKLKVELNIPKVAYRETIINKVKVQGKHRKQSGGHGQYGDVWIEFEPSDEPSTPYVFEEKIFGGSVPKGYFPAVEKGLDECVKKGPIAGYPVVGIKATLVDGSYHDVDSSEMAFKLATNLAFREAFKQAKTAILEPIATVKVYVPSDYTGDIMGDMNKRRGRILGMEKEGNKQVISAEVPMSEMTRYSIELRSMTQGRGDYTMEFERYEEAPAEIQQKVIEESQQ